MHLDNFSSAKTDKEKKKIKKENTIIVSYSVIVTLTFG